MDTLLKQLKAFVSNLAVDLVRDKAGILSLADRFPAKVRGTFRGLFECYVDQARPPARAPATQCTRRSPGRAQRLAWGVAESGFSLSPGDAGDGRRRGGGGAQRRNFQEHDQDVRAAARGPLRVSQLPHGYARPFRLLLAWQRLRRRAGRLAAQRARQSGAVGRH